MSRWRILFLAGLLPLGCISTGDLKSAQEESEPPATGGTGAAGGVGSTPDVEMGGADSERDCVPGESLGPSGACEPCPEETFTAEANASECTPWKTCDGDWEVIAEPGSATADAACANGEGMVQVGTIESDYARDVALDSKGNVYLAGSTYGDLAGDGEGGSSDAFVMKLSHRTGEVEWVTEFQTSWVDGLSGIAVDHEGNVVVAGSTSDSLGGVPQQNLAGTRPIVAKLSGETGERLWITHFGSRWTEWASDLALDAEGNVYVGGSTEGNIDGSTRETHEHDGFIALLSGDDGELLWTEQFGGPGEDRVRAIAVDAAGDVIVGGTVSGQLDGELLVGGETDGFVRKVNGDTRQLEWSHRFGTTETDVVDALLFDQQGDVFVAGSTDGQMWLTENAGEGGDAFVAHLSGATGESIWTAQFGSADDDGVDSIHLDGDWLLVGGDTDGEIAMPNGGRADAFMVPLQVADGEIGEPLQIGEVNPDRMSGFAVDSDGQYVWVINTENALAPPHIGRTDILVWRKDFWP